ncbi:MAG TPA: FAD-binding oxidoreductase [Methanomicrobia archaeon]|nr:FAD-binding oxidoreductase [Methanomicrobia archaeon]
MRNKAEVVIIGGGITGCGVAYNLAKMGLTDVVLVEKNFLSSGATGRCGGGIRQQFTTEWNIRLAMESVKRFEKMNDELDIDIEYEQGGYLVITDDEKELEEFKKNVKLQNKLGLDSKLITPSEAKEIVPYLNEDNILGATFCQSDGHAYPFRVVQGYAKKAKEMGVEINKFTEVKSIKKEDNKIKSVVTDRGEIKTNIVVNAAGAYSREIAGMIGVEMPNKPFRHEILATERYKHILDPMIISFKYGIYFSQQKHGEIVGGIGDPDEPSSYNIKSSLKFVERFTSVLGKIVPAFKNLNIVRQWAGFYDVTPDAKPILGYTEGIDTLIQANGYSGHGFMVAPRVTELIAELIVDGKTSMPIDELNLKRFEGETVGEVYVVG